VNPKITGAAQKALVTKKKASTGTQGSRTIFKVSKNALFVNKNLLKGQLQLDELYSSRIDGLPEKGTTKVSPRCIV
jgi:hypothetical protein